MFSVLKLQAKFVIGRRTVVDQNKQIFKIIIFHIFLCSKFLDSNRLHWSKPTSRYVRVNLSHSHCCLKNFHKKNLCKKLNFSLVSKIVVQFIDAWRRHSQCNRALRWRRFASFYCGKCNLVFRLSKIQEAMLWKLTRWDIFRT